MRRTAIFSLFILSLSAVNAQNAFQAGASGNWSDIATWLDRQTLQPATRIPNGNGDTVYILTHAVNLDLDTVVVNSLYMLGGKLEADSFTNRLLVISSNSAAGIQAGTQAAEIGVRNRAGGISLWFQKNDNPAPEFGIADAQRRLRVWIHNLVADGDINLADTVNVTGAVFPRSGTIKTNDRLVLRATSDVQYGQISGVGNGTFNGQITAEMQIHGGASWRQYGSPFDAPLSELNDDITLSYQGGPFNPNTWNTYNWREAREGNRFLVAQSLDNDSFKVDGTWTVFTQATPAPRFPRRLPFTLDIKGIYRGNGDFSLKNRTFSLATAGTFDTLGVHHISNPYPSCVRWNADIQTHVQGNAYAVWREHIGSFGFYNGVVGTNGADEVIPPFTVMYIKVNDPTNEILFRNSDRTLDNRSYFASKKKDPQGLARFKFSGQNRADEVIFYSEEGAKMQWGKEDVFKIYNGNFYLNVFTLLNDTINTAISVMDTLSADSQRFRVIFVTDQEGSYTLDATLENADTARNYWFYDYETNTTLPMNSGPYTFTHKKTNPGHRFDYIVGKRREAPEDSAGNSLHKISRENLKAWAYDGIIWLESPDAPISGIVEIFTTDGRLVHSQNLAGIDRKQSLNINWPADNLVIIRWTGNGGGSKLLYRQ